MLICCAVRRVYWLRNEKGNWMLSHDRSDKEWAKISSVKIGDKIEVDANFSCMPSGTKEIHSDQSGLFVVCESGRHYLSGQADDGEHLIGMYESSRRGNPA